MRKLLMTAAVLAVTAGATFATEYSDGVINLINDFADEYCPLSAEPEACWASRDDVVTFQETSDARIYDMIHNQSWASTAALNAALMREADAADAVVLEFFVLYVLGE